MARPGGQAKFVEGNLLRHITVMSLTSSVGLMAIFAVDLMNMVFISWLKDEEILDGLVYRFECAYPILENGYERILGVLLEYLGTFRNLHGSGRNGLFAYSWLHDMMLSGRDIVRNIVAAEGDDENE